MQSWHNLLSMKLVLKENDDKLLVHFDKHGEDKTIEYGKEELHEIEKVVCSTNKPATSDFG